MTGLLGFCGGGGGTSGVRPSFGSIANGPAAGAAPVRVGPLSGSLINRSRIGMGVY